MTVPSTPTAGWVYPTPRRPIDGRPAPGAASGGLPFRPPRPTGPPGPRPGATGPYGSPNRRRRTGLIVGLIAGGVAFVVAVTAALIVVHTFVEPRDLSSANGVVTMEVPGSWDDLTSIDAGQPYTAADEHDEWTVPDLEAEDFLGDAHLSGWVSDAGDDVFTAVQNDLVATTCDQEGCLSRGTPTSTTVAGQPAVQQLLRHPGTKDYGSSSTLVVSITKDETVVSTAIWWDEYVDLDTAKLLRSVSLTR